MNKMEYEVHRMNRGTAEECAEIILVSRIDYQGPNNTIDASAVLEEMQAANGLSSELMTAADEAITDAINGNPAIAKRMFIAAAARLIQAELDAEDKLFGVRS